MEGSMYVDVRVSGGLSKEVTLASRVYVPASNQTPR